MNQDLSHWLLLDRYSLDQAALLFAGIDPYEVNCSVEDAFSRHLPQAGRAKFIQHLIESSCNELNGILSRIMPEPPDSIECLDGSWELLKKDLLNFAAEKGLDFPYGCPVPEAESEQGSVVKPIEEIMTASHDNYSENLMEAITVWKELAEISSSDDLKTPRKKADEIIRSRYPEWSQRRVDAITQVVNWTENTEKSSVLSPPRPVTLKNVKESA